MSLKRIKLIFLGLAVLFSGITAGYFYLFEREAPDVVDAYYLQNVQEQISESIKTANTDLNPLQLSLPISDGILSIVDLPQSSYPYFLFKKDTIQYWSDNTFVPDFAQIKDIAQFGVLSDEENKFVVVRTPLSNKEYACVSLIPISEHHEVNYKRNDGLFKITPEEISNKQFDAKYRAIVSPDNKVLFYLKSPEVGYSLQPLLPDNTLNLLGFTVLLLGVFCLLQIGEYINNHRFISAFVVLLLFLLFVKWLFEANNIPLIKFNSNRWGASLGDRLINGFVLAILVGFLATYFYRSSVYYYIIKSKQLVRSFFAVCCVVLMFVLSYLLITELNNLLVSSEGRYSYGLVTTLDLEIIALYSYYLLLSIIFFLASHIFIYVFSKLFPHKIKGILHWLYGFILSFILLAVLNDLNWKYLLVGVYFLLVYFFHLSRSFYVFRFKTSLYFFLSAFVFAILSTVVLHQYLYLEKRNEIREISQAVFSNNDLVFEKLISSKIADIEADELIKVEIIKETLALERVTREVKGKYFDGFINAYEAEVYAFNSTGESLDILSDSKQLSDWEDDFVKEGATLLTPGVYKVLRPDGNAVFYGKATIKQNNGIDLGTVLIELDELLLTENITSFNKIQNTFAYVDNESTDYSYGLFDTNGTLLRTQGSFNYIDYWNTELIKDENFLTNGFTENGFQHYGVKNSDGKVLIVSLIDHGLFAEWSNLSFLFLISVFAVSFILVFYSFRHGINKRSKMNFTTRIQLYLNTAFLLPLLLILIITISVVGATLERNQANGFRENSMSLASTIQLLASDLISGKMSEAFFEQELDELSQSSKVDFSIYDENGKQKYVSNNDFAYSPVYLNAIAFAELIDKNERQLLLEESSFDEIYLTSYVGVSLSSDEWKLVLRVPHLGSENILNKQLKSVISSILNIFIFLFVFLLIAAFVVSRQLTNPIRTVTGHLRKTNLDKLDEPLPLEETNDEMGILVRAYNRMLEKLEESKIALSNSEKQTAWREMAKQVAHEIKNPLTPMKLSIQQLQRTLPTDNPNSRQRIERALNSLNEQIDNISEIANSFSEFAKMPVPTLEDFDLIEVIQKVADLYTTNKNSDFQLVFLQPKLMVRGDRQLMSRVLTNLIINGLQSVPIDRRPKIQISAYKNDEDSFAIVEVKDNGVGVSEEIREKVFIPNFSTKVGGSGLGLALAKRGIEHGGGNIWFETEVNIGTSFYVDLPIAR